jgi:hypothetical protein
VSAVSARDSFLLRIDPEVLEAVRRWADDELRSINGQIEWALRKALRDAGRLRDSAPRRPSSRQPRSES